MAKKNYNYDLNNPMERYHLDEDARDLFGKSEIILFAPASLTVHFNTVSEAIWYIMYHAKEVDAIGDERFVSCRIINRESRDIGISIVVALGEFSQSYLVKRLDSLDFHYRPDNRTVKEDVKEEAKVVEKCEIVTPQPHKVKLEYPAELVEHTIQLRKKNMPIGRNIAILLQHIAPDVDWTHLKYKVEPIDDKSTMLTIDLEL
jgi:hypothetical protein